MTYKERPPVPEPHDGRYVPLTEEEYKWAREQGMTHNELIRWRLTHLRSEEADDSKESEMFFHAKAKGQSAVIMTAEFAEREKARAVPNVVPADESFGMPLCPAEFADAKAWLTERFISLSRLLELPVLSLDYAYLQEEVRVTGEALKLYYVDLFRDREFRPLLKESLHQTADRLFAKICEARGLPLVRGVLIGCLFRLQGDSESILPPQIVLDAYRDILSTHDALGVRACLLQDELLGPLTLDFARFARERPQSLDFLSDEVIQEFASPLLNVPSVVSDRLSKGRQYDVIRQENNYLKWICDEIKNRPQVVDALEVLGFDFQKLADIYFNRLPVDRFDSSIISHEIAGGYLQALTALYRSFPRHELILPPSMISVLRKIYLRKAIKDRSFFVTTDPILHLFVQTADVLHLRLEDITRLPK